MSKTMEHGEKDGGDLGTKMSDAKVGGGLEEGKTQTEKESDKEERVCYTVSVKVRMD